MHMNVHCSTLYNSKDLEPTQMPINDRLYKENGIVRSHNKEQYNVLYRNMDEAGGHHT